MMKRLIKVFLLAILAGVAIGLGSISFVLLKTAGTKFFASMAFSIGLLLVCFCGFNLYTGKIGFVLENKKSFILDLFVIYLGNIVGGVAFGYLSFACFKNVDSISSTMNAVTACRMIENGDPWYNALIMSFFCGMLVFLAVYGYKKIPHWIGKALCIIVCVTMFVYCGMEHCIANMIYFSFNNSWCGSAFLNILITTVGNSLGAIVTYLGAKRI